jgi:hypothetical protein
MVVLRRRFVFSGLGFPLDVKMAGLQSLDDEQEQLDECCRG